MLRGFDDLAATDAAGARENSSYARIHLGADALQIRFPTASSPIVGVTHHVAGGRVLAANFTNSCHRFLVCGASVPQHRNGGKYGVLLFGSVLGAAPGPLQEFGRGKALGERDDEDTSPGMLDHIAAYDVLGCPVAPFDEDVGLEG